MSDVERQKSCMQLDHPDWQTDCFHRAGNLPCSNPDCAVREKLRENPAQLRMGVGKDGIETFIRCILFHQVCRMSSMSADNGEFHDRTK